MGFNEENKAPRKDLDLELDRLETQIAELKIQYEQHFAGILPRAPEDAHKLVKQHIKQLLRAPFKNSATKFKLQTLISRFQTYATYWERVLKQKEEGTYSKDTFKTELRDKISKETTERSSPKLKTESALKQLYDSYEAALKKTGANTKQLNFASFRESLLKKSAELSKQHGSKKMSFKVNIKDGKVILKAQAKKE